MNLAMSRFRKYWAPLLIVLYILLHLATLTKFPLMHSDESWLSGLSRHYLVTGDFTVTEPFFNLKPRNPHALKIIFHSLQMLAIKLLGYSLFNIRLLSLVCGLATLYFFYRLCRLVLPVEKWALGACLLMGIDIQYIYASHFGRQEIVLLWAMVFGLYYYFKNLDSHRYRRDLILGALAGLSIGVHPNGLILILLFGGIYLTHILQKRVAFRSILVWGSACTCCVLFFIALSYRFDPDFPANYLNYGEEQFKVLRPFTAKLSGLIKMAKNIYFRQGGTYYLPDLKIQILLVITLLTGWVSVRLRKTGQKQAPTWLLASFIAIIAGFIIIGRYNTTGVVLLTPFIYLLVGFSLAKIPGEHGKIALPLLTLATLISTLLNIYPYLKYDYYSYLREITATVGPGRRVLASLNTEYAFEDGNLFDLRNLSFIKRQGLTFDEYISRNRIEYIIYPEGLDFIYQSRPKWNGVYGHLPYYLELQQFIKKKCDLIHSFAAPAYGIEIPAYVGRKKWLVRIYRVIYDSTSSKRR